MAEVVRAWVWWPGPRINVLRVFRDEALSGEQDTEVLDEGARVAAFWELDEREERTGRLAGVEIVDFLTFNKWGQLPKSNSYWQLPGWDPLPLSKLLKRKQQELREESLAPADGR